MFASPVALLRDVQKIIVILSIIFFFLYLNRFLCDLAFFPSFTLPVTTRHRRRSLFLLPPGRETTGRFRATTMTIGIGGRGRYRYTPIPRAPDTQYNSELARTRVGTRDIRRDINERYIHGSIHIALLLYETRRPELCALFD